MEYSYDENIIHLKDFDYYKKYGKFFVVRELYFGSIRLSFGDNDVYALFPFPENVEKILEEHFKTEIRNEIRKNKLKQLENHGNKI